MHFLTTKFKPLLLSLCYLLLCSPPQFAQSSNIKFEHFSVEDGLSHTNIRKIVQDHQGFIWFATPDGLNKYDGYEFTSYRHEPYDETSLAANSINDIFVDQFGVFWVGSFDGLNRYNPATDRFIRYQNNPDDSTSLPVNYVSAIGEDSEGTLWVASYAGLAALRKEDRSKGATVRGAAGKFTHYRAIRGVPNGLGNNTIRCLSRDIRPGSKAVWIGTVQGGVNRFDPQTGKFTYLFGVNAKIQPLYTRYSPETLKFLDRLLEKKSPVGSIFSTANDAHLTREINVENEGFFLVISLGEVWDNGLYDYGWLENAESGKVVWKMDPAKTLCAGGHPKNRWQIEALRLKPGRYLLHYQTDDSHSYPNWNAQPPKYESFWGIQLLEISAEDARKWQMLTRETVTPDFLSGNNISAIYPDVDAATGEYLLWVGTYGTGLNRVVLPATGDSALQTNPLYHDFENAEITHFYNQENNPHSLPGNYINAIIKTRRGSAGNLWIGLPGGGLARMEKFAGSGGAGFADRFVNYTHDASNLYSLLSNNISTLHEDPSGTLWIGTTQGANKLSPRKLRFEHYTNSLDPKRAENTLPGARVSCIFEDNVGEVWVGTTRGSLSRFDPKTGRFAHDHHFAKNALDSGRFYVESITETVDKNGRALWLGTSGNGLIEYRPQIGKIIRHDGDFEDLEKLSSNVINVVYADSKGMLWVGTRGGGLNKFNPRSGEVKRYLPAPGVDIGIPNANYPMAWEIWAICEDHFQGKPALWIGTVGGYLSRLDAESDTFTHFIEDVNDQTTINNKSITNIFVDKTSAVWVGTYSGGLNKFDRKTESFRHFTVKNGLANNMIWGILEDDRGNLWISTNGGLSRFDPLKEQFQNYDVNDGLQSNLFTQNAFAKSRSGKMFFGGVNGFTCFYPDSITRNLHRPPIVLTNFKKFDKSVSFDKPLAEIERIELDYNDNFFSFEFVALDYTNSLKNQYAYRLEGFDSDWIYCGARRYASYTNLDPGEYNFRVKGANSDGVWNEEGVSLKIKITPPFWKTGWFYVLAVVTLIAAAWAFHAYRLRVKVEQVRQVERVRKKAAADFHDELGHKLTKISLFSEIIKRRLSGASSENVEYLARINDISGGLYNGMRDFLWTLDPEKDSLFEIAIRLKDFGDEFFDKTGISFHVEGIDEALKHQTLSMDWKRHLLLIFKEGMNNILKHAGCKNVTLAFSLDGKLLKIILSDDGIGYRNGNGKPANSGGEGVRNMRQRAEKLGSELRIHEKGGGCGTVVEFHGEII